MTCSPGDLVLIPFPFSDLKGMKKHPVLVLTAPDRHGDFIGLSVTSVRHPEPHIAIDSGSLGQGTLPKPSWVRVDKVFTIEQSLILRVLGRLDSVWLKQALAALCKQVGYA